MPPAPPIGTVGAVVGTVGMRERAIDAVAAVALAAINATILPSFGGLPWPAYALSLTYCLLLAVRRYAPLPVTAAALGAAGLYGAMDYPIVGLGLVTLVWA